MQAEQIVFKFRVTDGLGRSSAIWRLWTGSNKPTNDAYLAPIQIVNDIKVSLHKDGYCQIGPCPQLRKKSFQEDRYAFSRWRVDTRQVPCPLLSLEFARSQFRAMPNVDDVFDVVLPEGVEAIRLIVSTTSSPSPAMSPGENGGVWTVATLAREDSSTAISLFGVFVDESPKLHETARTVTQPPSESWGVWKMPVDWEDSPFGWAVADLSPFKRWMATRRHGLRPVPNLIEFSADSTGDHPFVLPGFDGDVEPWESCPVDLPPGADACAVLTVSGERQFASVYLNEHARCDHRSLASDANRVVQGFRIFGPDDGWDPLLDEANAQIGWRTALATPPAALRARFHLCTDGKWRGSNGD